MDFGDHIATFLIFALLFLLSIIFYLDDQKEEYKIYNECYKIEDKFYCKN